MEEFLGDVGLKVGDVDFGPRRWLCVCRCWLLCVYTGVAASPVPCALALTGDAAVLASRKGWRISHEKTTLACDLLPPASSRFSRGARDTHYQEREKKERVE